MSLIIVIIVAVLLYVIVSYNGMIKMRNQVKEAWADIDVQLKRRYNLIPNIVETVKGYATHESDVLTKVTEARANAINATNIKDQGAAENMLSGALKSLFAVAENYPELKANENFLQLQNELVDTEDKIQSARRFFNSVTRDFNTKIQQFPAKIVAMMFAFKAEEFFEIEEEKEREVVDVDFSKEKAESAPAEPSSAEPSSAEATEKKEEAEKKPEEQKEVEPIAPQSDSETTSNTLQDEGGEKPAEGAEPVESADEPKTEAPEQSVDKDMEEGAEAAAAASEKPDDTAEGEEKPEAVETQEPASQEEEKKEEVPAEEPKEEEKPEEPKEEEKAEEEPPAEDEKKDEEEEKKDNPDQASMSL